MTGEVLVTRAGAVAQIGFNNPAKRNAMSLSMWEKLGQAIRSLEHENGVRAIVLRGTGDKAFVSGADISEFDNDRSEAGNSSELEGATRRALESIRLTTKPTVAMIHGYCFGAGLAIAAACDLRYARDDAKFSIPAAKLGFGYAVHLTADLVRLVGPARTKEILLTARTYTADEALRVGIVHDVFSADTFEDKGLDVVEALSTNAPLTMRAAKIVVNALTKFDPASGLAQDAERAVAACFASEDAVEGRVAFAEKRAPEFKGQ